MGKIRSKYSENLWAEELGIDITNLLREHPCHIDQIRNTRRINKQGAEYWARERFLAQVTANDTAEVVPVVKKPGRRAKVRRYEFTDAQLQIARRSLDAEGSV
jgi:hypothetical protein